MIFSENHSNSPDWNSQPYESVCTNRHAEAGEQDHRDGASESSEVSLGENAAVAADSERRGATTTPERIAMRSEG